MIEKPVPGTGIFMHFTTPPGPDPGKSSRGFNRHDIIAITMRDQAAGGAKKIVPDAALHGRKVGPALLWNHTIGKTTCRYICHRIE